MEKECHQGVGLGGLRQKATEKTKNADFRDCDEKRGRSWRGSKVAKPRPYFHDGAEEEGPMPWPLNYEGEAIKEEERKTIELAHH